MLKGTLAQEIRWTKNNFLINLFFNDFFKVFPKLVKNVTKKWAKIEKIQLNFEWLYLSCYSTYIKNKTSFETLKPYIFYLNNN